jgi:hypothetical protein
MPESGTSGSVRGRDGKPPGLLDLHYYREANTVRQHKIAEVDELVQTAMEIREHIKKVRDL